MREWGRENVLGGEVDEDGSGGLDGARRLPVDTESPLRCRCRLACGLWHCTGYGALTSESLVAPSMLLRLDAGMGLRCEKLLGGFAWAMGVERWRRSKTLGRAATGVCGGGGAGDGDGGSSLSLTRPV